MNVATSKNAMKASDLMSRAVITVGPLTEISAAARLLVEKGITGAPVVDHEGRLLGVVSQTDLTRFQAQTPIDGWEERSEPGLSREATPVAAVMTPAPVTCAESTPIDEVARLMLERRIHRVLVVTDGRLAGIVTSMDLLRALPSAGADLEDPLRCRWL